MVLTYVYTYRILSPEGAFMLVDTDIPCSKIKYY